MRGSKVMRSYPLTDEWLGNPGYRNITAAITLRLLLFSVPRKEFGMKDRVPAALAVLLASSALVLPLAVAD
jgi:hypothetical protein